MVNLRTISVVVFQLLVIIVAVVAGYYFTRDYNIIPKAVLRLPEVYVSHSDMWSIASTFFIVYFVQILLSQLIFKDHGFENVKRFANEYLFYLCAYTIASLYLFLATTINYDGQLIAAMGLFSTIAYLLAMLVIQTRSGNGFIDAGKQVIGSLFARMLSVKGGAVLVFFLVPLMLGKAFTSDRDIANVITQVRIFFNPVESSNWGFKNKLPGIVFEQPVLVTQAQGDQDSIYILERVGKVYKASAKGAANKELLLDLSENMGEIEVENGAVGLAFHPGFNADKPFAFIYYTDTRPEGYQLNKLSRFDLSLDSVVARKQSETTILEFIRGDDGFHNGGSLEFGPDGFLYVGLGESVHPRKIKKSSEVLSGGILRLDIDMDENKSVVPGIAFKHGKAANYLVPRDNPFIGNDQVMDEYWALGFRNPFRFTFDSLNGDLWVGDVGSTVWEEVNRVEKGKHYQFPMLEGRSSTGKSSWEDLGIEQQGPVYSYEHNAYDRAVIGGVVDRGELYPELKNRYIFADNYSAKVFAIDANASEVEEAELLARANQYAQRGVSSVVQLSTGEILITTLGAASEASGEVLQLVRADQADVFEEQDSDSAPKDYNEDATASLFAVNCSRCHGATGDGKGPDSELLAVELPDFTSPMFHYSRNTEVLTAAIADGGIAVGKSALMPPWGGFLKPEEIEHLVIYIQALPEKHHQH